MTQHTTHEHKPVEQQFPQPTVRADAPPAHRIDVEGYETLEIPRGFTIAGLLTRLEALEAKTNVKPDVNTETADEVEAAEDAKPKAVKAESKSDASAARFTGKPTPKA